MPNIIQNALCSLIFFFINDMHHQGTSDLGYTLYMHIYYTEKLNGRNECSLEISQITLIASGEVFVLLRGKFEFKKVKINDHVCGFYFSSRLLVCNT